MAKKRCVIDYSLRLKALNAIYPLRGHLHCRLEVKESTIIAAKKGAPHLSRDLTQPGMLYEILAMHHAGWLNRGSNRPGGIHYWITALGMQKHDEIFGKIRVEEVKKKLEAATTRQLLEMLKKTRVSGGYLYADCWETTSSEIKAELAKRPHLERRAQRRARMLKKEKGDVKRREAVAEPRRKRRSRR